MNRDELLAAAETVVQAAHDYPGDEWLSQKVVTAADELATHVQRLYDPTPVDEAWLKAVGFVWTRQFWNNDTDMMLYHKCGNICYERWHTSGSDEAWGFSLGTRYKLELHTRGDVRRLCDALGIELREDA